MTDRGWTTKNDMYSDERTRVDEVVERQRIREKDIMTKGKLVKHTLLEGETDIVRCASRGNVKQDKYMKE